MERRNFLKLAIGVAAGAATFTAAAQAAPLSPQPLGGPASQPRANADLLRLSPAARKSLRSSPSRCAGATVTATGVAVIGAGAVAGTASSALAPLVTASWTEKGDRDCDPLFDSRLRH